MSTEDLAERLRRLRRERRPAGAGPNPVDPSAANSDASVRRTLARRGARLKRNAPDAVVEYGEPPQHMPLGCGLPRDLECAQDTGAGVLARGETFVRAHRHGAMQLGEVMRADPRAFVLLTRDEDLAAVDLERAIYLDTETSGLSGGAGTYVFMVGLGTFEGPDFRVWQGFLDDPAHERALLAETARRVRAAPAIVSFFGKSFDRHRLEDRMRCLGIDPPFEGRAHLDLYHPLRRLYRGAFPDQRLRTLESALCGVQRDDDLPGSFAPAAWFDFLAGRPHRLEGVFRHNRDDVLSLVTLAAHLGQVLQEHEPAAGIPAPGVLGLAAARAANLARTLSQAGDPSSALARCEAALAHLAAEDRRARELRVLRADLLRRIRDLSGSLRALRALAGEEEDEHTAAVLLALARLEKRELGDPGAAQATCVLAARAAMRRLTGRDLARFERALESLRSSLERRAERAGRRSRRPA
jgi:uncharacterized protein YprB with RNaseH-like and TPR domain